MDASHRIRRAVYPLNIQVAGMWRRNMISIGKPFKLLLHHINHMRFEGFSMAALQHLWGQGSFVRSFQPIAVEFVCGARKLVPPARFQRATFRLGGGRSMQLSYGSLMARIQ